MPLRLLATNAAGLPGLTFYDCAARVRAHWSTKALISRPRRCVREVRPQLTLGVYAQGKGNKRLRVRVRDA